ncbi:MAG: hypothetical protein ABFD92_01970 [Planctomycetaceae bacterium]
MLSLTVQVVTRHKAFKRIFGQQLRIDGRIQKLLCTAALTTHGSGREIGPQVNNEALGISRRQVHQQLVRPEVRRKSALSLAKIQDSSAGEIGTAVDV